MRRDPSLALRLDPVHLVSELERHTEIREVIDDPTREAEAIRLMNGLEADLGTLMVRVAERKQQVRQLNAKYATTRAEFEFFMQQSNRAIRENRQRAGAGHRAFLDAVTNEEFSEIRKTHSKAMQAAIKSYQAI